ncbi:MAG: transposase [Oligoflexia bacterium]|nr:transposase [Oligoflexia bacterium]
MDYYYIGLDAHIKTSSFVVLDTKGQEISKVKVETREKDLLSVVRGLKGKPRKLVLEEMPLSQWLYLLFKKEGVEEVVVCNPVFLGKNCRSKTDYNDALHLANELRCGHISSVYHADDPFIKMRSLVSNYEDLNTSCVRAKNRYKSIFRSRGLRVKGGPSFYKKRANLDLLEYREDRFVTESLFKQIEDLTEQKEKFKRCFLEYKRKNITIKNLTTIPGIDIIRSMAIAGIVSNPHRFKNKHKFWSYCMLVKHKRISDGKVYGTRVRYVRKELKGVFIVAAESNLKTRSSLKRQYDELCSKGLDRRKSRKAIARKLAGIALSIMKKGGKYDDKRFEKLKSLK